MQAHIVLAHPEPKSFNARLAAETRRALGDAGWRTTFADLYAMDFDAREGPRHFRARDDATTFHTQIEQRFSGDNGTRPDDVQSEIDNLAACDLLVVHFPLWWFGMPAILKGWMDRVFVYGGLYRSTMRFDTGFCRGKKVIACVTTGAPEASCGHDGQSGDTRLILWPALLPYRYLGFDVYEPEILHGVGGTAYIEGRIDGLGSLDAYVARWTATLETLADRRTVPFNANGDFDDTGRLKPYAPAHSPFIRHRAHAVVE